MEFRPRDYGAEKEAHSLPRVRADDHDHPLSVSPPSAADHQIDITDGEIGDFFDPLRGPNSITMTANDSQDVEDMSNTVGLSSSNTSIQLPAKEWSSFKRFLMQKFPVSKTISISSMSDVIVRSGNANEKSVSSTHLEELEDPQKFAEEGVKVITRQEYVTRLHELKDEISRAWHAEDRVISLKLSIKVARLLMDTSVMQFYPTLFVLAMDVMDMLGDMVWERIKRRAEFAEDGALICSLPDNFEASNVCDDAKETCNNWFCKIASIRELLPRIYLELAILPCRTFLVERPADSLKRLVMMTRGVADPLASAYCHLYMAHRAQKLPSCDIGFFISCINDIKVLLARIISTKDSVCESVSENRRLLVSLMEPTIEYIMKCIFKDACERQVGDVFMELGFGTSQSELFGNNPYISIVLHHLLIEVPVEFISFNALEILQLIECSNDFSFDQCLNYKLLGLRLCERRSQMDIGDAVMDKVMKVVDQYNGLDDYLKVVDAYVDIILQNQMDNFMDAILEGILKRAHGKQIAENELTSLQSIFVKLLSQFKDLEDVFALNHFVEILDVIHGSSRKIVNVHILTMVARNDYISNPTTIRLLFEISQSLHDVIDFSNGNFDDNQQPTRLICRFVQMVDYGEEVERHLSFLVECRGALGNINELKETIVHASNCLAIKAIKHEKKHASFVKSCIAFSEVTIPAISGCIRQLNLYLETAEVALFGGLVSHLDDLVDLALISLQNLDLMKGSHAPKDIDDIACSIGKLCSLLVVVPGKVEQGVTCIPKTILSVVNTISWITPGMRIRILCAIVSLSATLSQTKLPYHASHAEVFSNDLLFFGDSSYLQEFMSFSESVLQDLVDVIHQEPSRAARGRMALEACNCIASSFKITAEISPICSKLVETAKLCVSSNDKYLQSTMRYLDKNLQTFPAAITSIAI